jgi:type IV pilus assembly protein PilY1
MSPFVHVPWASATPGSIDIRTAASADVVDGEQSNWIVNARSPSYQPRNVATFVAWRFTNVQIPQGATITSATLTVYSNQIATWATTADDRTLGIVDADNQAQATSGTMSAISGNQATTKHTWVTSGSVANEEAITTGDISSVLQQVISRTGWASGQALMFVSLHDGSTSNSHQVRGHDGESASLTPRLQVGFTS